MSNRRELELAVLLVGAGTALGMLSGASAASPSSGVILTPVSSARSIISSAIGRPSSPSGEPLGWADVIPGQRADRSGCVRSGSAGNVRTTTMRAYARDEIGAIIAKAG
jgi:hypothetical protein